METTQAAAARDLLKREHVSHVPFLDLARTYHPLRNELLEALTRVCDSGGYVLGPEVERLEQTLAAYCHCEHAIACASGSDAILLSLMALGIGPGDSVIVPSFTFFSTASAVVRLGALPIFADIDPQTYNISPDEVARLIDGTTKAIIPVHLYGQAADMEPILQLARQHGVTVIEDAAQSIGAEYRGRRVGSLGELGCLSFYPTKNLGGMGDAGMITTNNRELADKLRILRVHGMQPRYYHQILGINSRMDAFQAAVLNVKFPQLDSWIAQRAEIAARYYELFSVAQLDGMVELPRILPQTRHVWNQFVIRVAHGQRDAIRRYMNEHRVGTEIYYPMGLHEQQCFQHLGYAPSDLPHTFTASREVLALPIYPGLTAAEQHTVVQTIGDFFREHFSRAAVAVPYFLKQTSAPATTASSQAQP